jgi:hypothetical protein
VGIAELRKRGTPATNGNVEALKAENAQLLEEMEAAREDAAKCVLCVVLCCARALG